MTQARGLDPIRASERIRDAYRDYLTTAFPLADANLARQFRSLLDEPAKFMKGPFLEATPPFKFGQSLAAMVEEGLLSPSFRRLCGPALPWDRPLYSHQAAAIRQAVRGRNLVIATGTGSGKTESFLVPILDSLLREEEQGTLPRPGVRALLLYPMNALANDQLKRLRKVLEQYPSITFGRYTGETKPKASDAEQHFHKTYPLEKRIPNELLSRDEMRAGPPHILLTNYAMLEYLLLRPDDSEFFDGEHAGRWRFFVLDEVHTYNGAVGIEMAMLLRRLKDRVGPKSPIRCLATSATLGAGRDDHDAIARFATDLFGEPFAWDEQDEFRQDVVAAERESPTDEDGVWGEPQLDLYEALRAATQQPYGPPVSDLSGLAERYAIPSPVTVGAVRAYGEADKDMKVGAFLHRLLKGDGRLHRLRAKLADGAMSLDEAARSVTGGQKGALVALVDLAVRSHARTVDQPLLPARYHLFVRALEGAYIALGPEPELFLDRTQTHERAGANYHVFEAASCKQCGQVYLVGEVDEKDCLKQATLSEDNRDKPEFYLLLGSGDDEGIPTDEDEEVAEGAESDTTARAEAVQLLCGHCGKVNPAGSSRLDCKCRTDDSPSPPAWVRKVPTKDRQVNHCPSCGARSSGLVQRFLTGQDAPASVLAAALYQEMPPRRTPDTSSIVDDGDRKTSSAQAPRPGEGRKLLAFSDSRQDAAFFACYLDRTYGQILRRRLIVRVLERHPEAIRAPWRLQDLVWPLRGAALDAGLLREGGRRSRKELDKEVWTWLLLELMAFDRRNSLEGLGILSFQPVRPDDWAPPPALMGPPWGLEQEEVWILYQVLLGSFRTQGAITFPDEVSPKDEAFAPRDRERYFRQGSAVPKRGIFSWDSPAKRKQNRRLDYLSRLYQRINRSDDIGAIPAETLRKVWTESLMRDRSVFADHFAGITLKDEGVVYRYDHRFFELTGFQQAGWHRCDRCGGLTRLNLRGICPVYRCDGTLEPCRPEDALRDNHYARLYRELEPIPMHVEEHTAQLTSERAADLQERFIRDEINVLSCSTTFELGVDVGELEAVLLRNVPPEAANYIQRAGRAGRRRDATAFVLTFCQRRSHDLTHFQEPTKIIGGEIRPPRIELRNVKIIRRHANSVAFSWFFRRCKDYFDTVEAFAFPREGQCSGPDRLKAMLEERPVDLMESLGRIIPGDMQAAIGIEDWAWVEMLFGNAGPLRPAVEGVLSDVEQLLEFRRERFDQGKSVDHISRLIKTLKERRLIDFLANHNVLPKYGFPVDVVELELLHHGDEARHLELQRDLRIAIAEYAPGCELVAGGSLWTSRGLKSRPSKAWPAYRYAVCDQCGRYHRHLEEKGELRATCHCGALLSEAKKSNRTFVQPIFGFVTSDKPRKPSESRPARTYAGRVFFAAEGKSEGDRVEHKYDHIRLDGQFSKSGKLAVINSAGFWICQACGYSERVTIKRKKGETGHSPPWSPDSAKTCRGTLRPRDLGHEFETDLFELQIRGQSGEPRFWNSLLYALLEGASAALNIRRQDLDGCIYSAAGKYDIPALVLFDDVPGGAGHVRRIGTHLEAVLHEAGKRVSGMCGCGGGPDGPGDTSCYGCLRNYRNQWLHDQLQRGPVLRFLNQVVGVDEAVRG